MLLSIYWCISSLHWIDFCLQMWWVWVCCCLVPCLLNNLCHFLFVIGWFLVLLQMHLFLGIMACFCHKMLCMHLLLWWILLYAITSSNLHSRSTLLWWMSAVVELCLHLLCSERTYWDSLFVFGGGFSIIACSFHGSGFTPLLDIISPKKRTSIHLKWHLS